MKGKKAKQNRWKNQIFSYFNNSWESYYHKFVTTIFSITKKNQIKEVVMALQLNISNLHVWLKTKTINMKMARYVLKLVVNKINGTAHILMGMHNIFTKFLWDIKNLNRKIEIPCSTSSSTDTIPKKACKKKERKFRKDSFYMVIIRNKTNKNTYDENIFHWTSSTVFAFHQSL